MAYKLQVDHPEFPEGFEFDCDGILVNNGESVDLTKEDEMAFISRWGNDVEHFYGHGTIAKVTGSSALSKEEKEAAFGTYPEVEEAPVVEAAPVAEQPTDAKTKDGGDK